VQLGYGLDDPEFEFRQWQAAFPARLWGSPNLKLNGYRPSFSVVSSRNVKLTTNLHLAPRLGISGGISLPPLHDFIKLIGITEEELGLYPTIQCA